MATQKRFIAKNGVDNNNQTLINVADPVNQQDVATKGFSTDASNLTSGVVSATLIPALDATKITTGTLSRPTSGNAATATTLATARTINGVSFNGSANITINAVDSTARIASTEKGAVNGVAALDASGLVPSTQLPSYVDDVLEFANLAGFPVTGEAGKIYVALDTNKTYRWSGTVYIYITSGAVDSVAGKTGVVSLVKADVGLGSVDNTADSAKPVSTAQQTALNLKANLASPAITGTPTAPTAIGGTNTTQIATTQFVNEAVSGYLSKSSLTGGTITLTSDEAGMAIIYLTGALTSALNVVVPALPTKSWLVYNNTTGAFTTTVKTPLGTGVAVAQGKRNFVYSNGTNVYDAITDFESIALTGTPTAPTAAAATNSTQIATTAFVNAEIINDAAPIAHVGSGAASHAAVTTSVNGFMSAADKTKLNAITGTNTGDQTLASLGAQEELVSGTNIKTVNGATILGSGNIVISGGATLSDDTATNATYYPTFATAASGALTAPKVSSTKLTYNPSTGQLTATVFNATSDRNAKDNIQPITGALETVKNMQGVSFNWKDSGAKSYGYIAQDLEEVLPEVVATDAEGKKSVNYDATIAVLLEAIKSLSAKVDELEAKLA